MNETESKPIPKLGDLVQLIFRVNAQLECEGVIQRVSVNGRIEVRISDTVAKPPVTLSVAAEYRDGRWLTAFAWPLLT